MRITSGRLPERILERVLKRESVEAHFSLGDERLFMIVDELDRVFHRHDMAGVDRVAVIDHGGERRGFSGAGGADDQHQAALRHGDVFNDRREPSCFDRLDFGFDMPEDEADVASLPENVDTEPAELLVVQGQVHFHFLFELTTLLAAHQGEREGFELFVRKGRRVRWLGRAVDAVGRRRIDRQIHVGGFLIDHDFQQTANIHRDSVVRWPLSYAAPLKAVPPNRLGFMLRDWASALVTTPRVARSTTPCPSSACRLSDWPA